VITVANSTGEAVVQYFSGQTDVQPDACGSFVKMGNDNSRLAGACDRWYRGKWGWRGDEDRLYYHPAGFSGYYWLLRPNYPALSGCDDRYEVLMSAGDL